MTDLLSTSEALRQSVPAALTLTSPEAVGDKIIEIEEQRDRLKQGMNHLSDVIDQAESEKRKLGQASRELGTDVKKLENLKFDLIRQRKQANA